MLNRTTFWNLLSVYKINIPLIQRDYALGRKSEADRKDKLLHTIYTHLENKQNLNLDFVYGRVDCDIFTPIDGQERLTTLYLLHWYIAEKEKISIDERCLLNRYEYDTRGSSHQFCNALVNNLLKVPLHLQVDAISDIIKNKYWYNSTWDIDPTIQSMLAIIDAIHQKFRHTKDTSLWEYLTQEDNITFDWLDLGKKGYILTDHLYIKMNTRGKLLTQFENFKPNFIQFIAKEFTSKKILHPHLGEVTYADYFSLKIDQEWAEVFWTLREDKCTIDDSLSAYLRFVTQLLYRINNQQDKIHDINNSFVQYQEVYSKEENLLFLFNNFDRLYEMVINQGKADKESIDSFIDAIKEEVAMIVQESE